MRKYLYYSEHIPATPAGLEVLNLSRDNITRPKWAIGSRTYRSKNRIHNRYDRSNGGSLITFGEEGWSNYSFSFKMQGNIENGKNGAAFYIENNQNYYLLEFMIVDGRKGKVPQMRLSMVINGNKQSIASKLLIYNHGSFISFDSSDVSVVINCYQSGSLPDKNCIDIEINNNFKFSFESVEKISTSNGGKAGFYSLDNDSVEYSGIAVYSHTQSLLPSSRYELLLTGGEGGKTIIKDNAYTSESWDFVDSLKLYKDELEDFELIVNLESPEANYPIDLYLRYPGESRSDNNRSYYILRTSKEASQLIYTLISKNKNENIESDIEKSHTEIKDLIKIRVRFVGNQISVWAFEKLLFKVKLTDFSKESRLQDITIGKLNRINNRFSHLDIITDKNRALSNRSKPTEKINYKTAFDGLIAFKKDDMSKIKSIEIKDAYLFKTRFKTSKFANISALIEGYDKNIECIEVENLNNNISMQEFEESKLKSYFTKIKFENKVIEEGKVVDRDKFERRNQELAAEGKRLDETFYDLVSKIGNGDLAYEKNPDKLVLRILKENTEVKGIYLHAPEPLHIKFLLEGQIDTYGRMEILLKSADNNIINCFLLHNADSTKLLILPKDQNGDIKSLLTGVYTLNFNYTRDYKDDENEEIDHLFDRTYEMNRSNKNKYGGLIRLDII